MRPTLLLVVLALVAACPKPVALPPPDVNAPCSAEGSSPALVPFIGAWQPEDSAAIFRFCMVDGDLAVDGWDAGTDERFVISAVVFDGTELRFTSYFPSTRFTVNNSMRFEGDVLIDVRNNEGEGARMERKGERTP